MASRRTSNEDAKLCVRVDLYALSNIVTAGTLGAAPVAFRQSIIVAKSKQRCASHNRQLQTSSLFESQGERSRSPNYSQEVYHFPVLRTDGAELLYSPTYYVDLSL